MTDSKYVRYTIRELCEDDYYNGYIQLIKEGFSLNTERITAADFWRYVNDPMTTIFVVEDTEPILCNDNDVMASISTMTSKKIVASATVIIEQKLIHDMGRVGHIEDVVVSHTVRGSGIGKMIVNKCIDYAKKRGCYKCILDCSEENVGFYKKCNVDFQVKGVEMAIYY